MIGKLARRLIFLISTEVLPLIYFVSSVELLRNKTPVMGIHLSADSSLLSQGCITWVTSTVMKKNRASWPLKQETKILHDSIT